MLAALQFISSNQQQHTEKKEERKAQKWSETKVYLPTQLCSQHTSFLFQTYFVFPTNPFAERKRTKCFFRNTRIKKHTQNISAARMKQQKCAFWVKRDKETFYIWHKHEYEQQYQNTLHECATVYICYCCDFLYIVVFLVCCVCNHMYYG